MREYDLATVCKWIGNSPAVAAKHYAMSADLNADFQRATKPIKAQQKAQQTASAEGGQDMTKDESEGMEALAVSPVDDAGRLVSTGVGEGEWAIQDLNL